MDGVITFNINMYYLFEITEGDLNGSLSRTPDYAVKLPSGSGVSSYGYSATGGIKSYANTTTNGVAASTSDGYALLRFLARNYAVIEYNDDGTAVTVTPDYVHSSIPSNYVSYDVIDSLAVQLASPRSVRTMLYENW